MTSARRSIGWAGALLMSVALACDLENPPTAPPIRPSGALSANREGPLGGAAATAPAGFTTIDVPGATFTEALDITARGDIIGRYSTSDGKNHGYLQHEGVFTTIDVSPSYTAAQAVNERGDVVGQYLGPDGRFHGFLLRDGVPTTIDVPGAFATRAMGINAHGDIVGMYCDSVCPPTAYRADLGNRGFLLHEGSFTPVDFPGAVVTEPFKINARGDVVGRYRSTDGHWHVFLLREGAFTSIDVPGAIETASFPPPVGINDAGDIVSSFCPATPCPVRITDKLATLAHTRGFLLERGARDGTGPFTTIDFPGAIATGAYSINSRGDIVGAYVDANHKIHGFLRSRANAPM